MSQPDHTPPSDGETTIYEEYIMGIQLLEVTGEDGTRYRFDAPEHVGVEFEDPELAELYADVYFDVNGFVEDGTGDRGVPPEVIQGGKDTLAAYLLTLPGTDLNWVASFYGRDPSKIKTYVSWVRDRAEEIRNGAAEHGVDE